MLSLLVLSCMRQGASLPGCTAAVAVAAAAAAAALGLSAAARLLAACDSQHAQLFYKKLVETATEHSCSCVLLRAQAIPAVMACCSQADSPDQPGASIAIQARFTYHNKRSAGAAAHCKASCCRTMQAARPRQPNKRTLNDHLRRAQVQRLKEGVSREQRELCSGCSWRPGQLCVGVLGFLSSDA